MSKGESSGTTKNPIHENLFQFMNKHRAYTPRHKLGVEIAQTANTYSIFYMGSKDNKAKFFSYSPPCRGGIFVVN